MTGRPRVALVFGPDSDDEAVIRIRLWLLQSGADVVLAPSADVLAAESGGVDGVFEAEADVSRDVVVRFVRRLQGKPEHRFDSHGSAESWPRGSYGSDTF